MKLKVNSRFGFKGNEIVIFRGDKYKLRTIWSDGTVRLELLNQNSNRYKFTTVVGSKTSNGFYGINSEIQKTVGNLMKEL